MPTLSEAVPDAFAPWVWGQAVRVETPNPYTLVIHLRGGNQPRLVYRRKLSDWRPLIDVEYVTGSDPVESVVLVRNGDPDPGVIKFWSDAMSNAFTARDEADRKCRADALRILAKLRPDA